MELVIYLRSYVILFLPVFGFKKKSDKKSPEQSVG